MTDQARRVGSPPSTSTFGTPVEDTLHVGISLCMCKVQAPVSNRLPVQMQFKKQNTHMTGGMLP